MTNVLTMEVPINREIPDRVGVTWCADVFALTRAAVNLAIKQGRLPATKVGTSWAIRPQDAAQLWGHRLLRAKAS